MQKNWITFMELMKEDDYKSDTFLYSYIYIWKKI